MPLKAETLRLAGERVATARSSEVFNPYTAKPIATVAMAGIEDVRRAIATAKAFRSTLTRYDRYRICYRTAELLRARTEEIANLDTNRRWRNFDAFDWVLNHGA